MSGQIKFVSSHQNASVKLARSLELRKFRRQTGLFVAEGAKVVATARDRNWPARMLLADEATIANPIIADLIDWGLSTGAECLAVTHDILAKLSTKDNPQTIIGVFEQRMGRWPDRAYAPQDVVIALEEVRDPGNLGTIIRSADAAGVSDVVLVGTCCDPFSREAVRSTMGSIFAVPVHHLEKPAFLARMVAWPGASIGTHLSGRQDYREPVSGPALLVMGSEGPGLTDEMASACSTLVKIPMVGTADSLNLAVATALMTYELRRPSLPPAR